MPHCWGGGHRHGPACPISVGMKMEMAASMHQWLCSYLVFQKMLSLLKEGDKKRRNLSLAAGITGGHVTHCGTSHSCAQLPPLWKWWYLQKVVHEKLVVAKKQEQANMSNSWKAWFRLSCHFWLPWILKGRFFKNVIFLINWKFETPYFR